MSRRVRIDPTVGIRISKPGFDALTAAPKDLIFGGPIGFLMKVDHGRLTLTSGMTQNFSKTFTFVPLVVISADNDGGVLYPITTYDHTTSGFKAAAGVVPFIGTPAEGKSCSWIAFMLPG